MYGMRPHGYPPGMPPEYGPPGSSKHQLPEGGRPPTPGADWEDEQAQALKRPRLVWTPQLHKRFVDAVEQLGIKNAVPKTIMQVAAPLAPRLVDGADDGTDAGAAIKTPTDYKRHLRLACHS